MLAKKELPVCPVITTVSLIGNKWKLLSGPNRFGELMKGIPGISQKVLTDNLRSMESDGLLIRTVYAEVPPRVDYRLSETGESLRPIMAVMKEWGESYQALMQK